MSARPAAEMFAVMLGACVYGLASLADELADELDDYPGDPALEIMALATGWHFMPDWRADPATAERILTLADELHTRQGDLGRQVRAGLLAIIAAVLKEARGEAPGEDSFTSPIDRIIAESSGWTPQEED